MSRRFGRNQKRAMRRAIEQQQSETAKWREAHTMATGLLQYNRRELNRLRNDIETCRRTLGPYYAGLPVTEFPERLEFDFRDYRPFRVLAGENIVEAHPVVGMCWKAQATRAMHFRVRCSDADVAYAITDAAIRSLPEDYLISMVSTELARFLVRELRRPCAEPRKGC